MHFKEELFCRWILYYIHHLVNKVQLFDSNREFGIGCTVKREDAHALSLLMYELLDLHLYSEDGGKCLGNYNWISCWLTDFEREFQCVFVIEYIIVDAADNTTPYEWAEAPLGP